MHIYIIADKVINLIRDANVFISYGKRFHPLHLIIYFRNNILLCASLHISDEPYLNGTLYVPREAISAYGEHSVGMLQAFLC